MAALLLAWCPAAPRIVPCRCHYEGRLTSGAVFDSSYQRRQPLQFSVGAQHRVQPKRQVVNAVRCTVQGGQWMDHSGRAALAPGATPATIIQLVRCVETLKVHIHWFTLEESGVRRNGKLRCCPVLQHVVAEGLQVSLMLPADQHSPAFIDPRVLMLPRCTQIGVGQVIRGWDIGILGAEVGARSMTRAASVARDLAGVKHAPAST